MQNLKGTRQRMGEPAEASPLAPVFARGVVSVLQLVAPIAPHLAEELWEVIGPGREPLACGGWPAHAALHPSHADGVARTLR